MIDTVSDVNLDEALSDLPADSEPIVWFEERRHIPDAQRRDHDRR